MTSHLPPDDFPWGALARYFAGELPPEGAGELERWIDRQPEGRELIEQLREVWSQAGELRQSWDPEAALRRIKQTPARPARVIRIPRFYHEDHLSPRQRALRVAGRVAAVVALTAGAGGFGWWLFQTAAGGREKQVAASEVATPRGQRASLRLPDGSQVMLGPASTLRYVVFPDRGPRTVSLEGEAYFVVTHDTARPFTVHSTHGTATDLGTRFGVQAYAADSAMQVVVADGRVALSRPPDTLPNSRPVPTLLLARGDAGRVTSDGRLSAERGIPVDRYLAWTEGRLEFRDTPMRDVVVQLGRWYDLELRLADSALGARRLTATFKDESAPEVLRLIAASLEVRVEKRGTVVTIREM